MYLPSQDQKAKRELKADAPEHMSPSNPVWMSRTYEPDKNKGQYAAGGSQPLPFVFWVDDEEGDDTGKNRERNDHVYDFNKTRRFFGEAGSKSSCKS